MEPTPVHVTVSSYATLSTTLTPRKYHQQVPSISGGHLYGGISEDIPPFFLPSWYHVITNTYLQQHTSIETSDILDSL